MADVDFSVNVISKSGTTTEPAVAFRFFRAELERRYGKEAPGNGFSPPLTGKRAR